VGTILKGKERARGQKNEPCYGKRGGVKFLGEFLYRGREALSLGYEKREKEKGGRVFVSQRGGSLEQDVMQSTNRQPGKGGDKKTLRKQN